MEHCFETYFSYKFDDPERIHDQAIEILQKLFWALIL